MNDTGNLKPSFPRRRESSFARVRAHMIHIAAIAAWMDARLRGHDNKV